MILMTYVLAAAAAAQAAAPVAAPQATIQATTPVATIAPAPRPAVIIAPATETVLRAGTEVPLVMSEGITTNGKKLRPGQRIRLAGGIGRAAWHPGWRSLPEAWPKAKSPTCGTRACGASPAGSRRARSTSASAIA